jgi:hypothetical protein
MLIRAAVMASLAAALIGGAPAVPPLPEVGFWVGGPTPVRRASDRRAVNIVFADHTHAAYEPGDDILGWTVVDLRRDPATLDFYVLLLAPSGELVELYPHVGRDPRPNAPRWHMRWAEWLHHCNQLDAIRYRAEGYIVVVGKPHASRTILIHPTRSLRSSESERTGHRRRGESLAYPHAETERRQRCPGFSMRARRIRGGAKGLPPA